MLADALNVAFKQAQVEDRLGDGILRASLNLEEKAAQLMLNVGRAGIGGDADGEVGADANRVRADVQAVVQAAHDVDQSDGIHVKDSGGVGIVAHLGRVAGDAQNVVQAERRGAQQVRLNGKKIAVTAGVMQNRLNTGVLLNLEAEALGAYARRGARRVRHADGVNAQLREQLRTLDFFDAVDALGRHGLNQRDETALFEQGTNAGARAQGRRRRLGLRLRRRASNFNARLRVQVAHRRAHRANVVGRGAAAAAHNLHSGLNGLAGKAGHVLRRAEINIAPLDGARHPGVGQGRQRQGCDRTHGLDGRKHGGWPGRAVDADGSGAPFGQQGRSLRGRRAIQAGAFVVHRHHHQHRQFGSHLAGRHERLARLVQRGHGFDAQHIHARFGQHANLLNKGRAGFLQAGFAKRLQTHPERTDGAGHPRLTGRLFLEAVDGLAGNSDAGRVDLGHFSRQAMPGQPEAVSAKGVGFKQLGASLQILLVNGKDQVGVRKIQLVIAAIDEDAAGVENGSHGAIGEDRTVGEDVGELGHSVAMLSHAGRTRQQAGRLCYTSVVIGLG